MIEFGMKSGQELGKIMRTIKEMVDSNPSLNDRETLLDIAKSLLVNYP